MAISKTSTTDSLVLRRNETLRLPVGIAWTVRVENGRVLVTREGDRRDHVLEAGGEVVIPAGGLAVAWAFTDARLSIRAVHRGKLAA